MTRKVLVHVYHPGNALGAMCSALWYGRAKGLPPAEVTALLSNPYVSQDMLENMADIVATLSAGQGWPRPIILSATEMAAVLRGASPPGPDAGKRFRQLIGHEAFDEVHYVHDVAGPVVGLALTAYPDAYPITFGDALGSLNNAAYHRALYEGRPVAACVAAGRGHARKAAKGLVAQAKTVVALLPTDQTGDCLEGKELLIVPREAALEIIASASEHLAIQNAYFHELLAVTRMPRFLYLLENIEESDFATQENALALQEEIIARNIPPGAGIILKPHPMSSTDLVLELSRRLSPRYAPVCLGKAFWRYPVEFMSPLLAACHPVCWSYGTLSLSFLSGKQLVHAIDENLIRRYMHRNRWGSMVNSMRLVTGPLANLNDWDRTGPLWSGQYETETGSRQ